MANSPETLEAYTTLMGLFERTSFDRVEREVILLAVSRENNCDYCLAAHGTTAAIKGVPKEYIDAIKTHQSIPDEGLDLLVSLVKSMVSTYGRAGAELVKRFFDRGYTSQHYLELVLGVSLKTLSNYINHAADTPLDHAFAVQARAA